MKYGDSTMPQNTTTFLCEDDYDPLNLHKGSSCSIKITLAPKATVQPLSQHDVRVRLHRKVLAPPAKGGGEQSGRPFEIPIRGRSSITLVF